MKVVLIVLLVLVVLYLLSIWPGNTKKKNTEPFMQVLYAHRGLYNNETNAPENTLNAFRKAVEGGYGMEMDVQLTKDNVPVVFHDFVVERMLKDKEGNLVKGKIKDYTYEELQQFHILNSDQTIPLFTDFLKVVDGKSPIIVELKIEVDEDENNLCGRVNKILSEYNGPYVVESFNPRGVNWYRKHRPAIVRGQLSDHFNKSNKVTVNVMNVLLEYLNFNFITKPDFIAYNWKYKKNLSRQLCRYLFKNLAVSYTIKSEQQLTDNWNDFDLQIFDSFVPSTGPLIKDRN